MRQLDWGASLHPLQGHLRNRTTRRRCVSLWLTLLVMGCGDPQPRAASVDSLLSRDLTLAAGETSAPRTPAIGDTAVTNPGAVTVSPNVRNRTDGVKMSRSPGPQAAARPAVRPTVARKMPASAASVPPVPAPVPAAPVPSNAGSNGVAEVGVLAGEAPGPSRGLAAGTALVAKTSADLCTLGNRPGDRIVAALTEPVSGPDGALLPAGTAVLIELAQASPEGVFAFRVRSVQVQGELVPAQGTVQVGNEVATTERQVSKGGDRGKVVTGAIIGAIAGRVLGGGARGTVIGAAGGAAAGTVAAARNKQTDRCLPAGATLTVTLSAPLVFPVNIP